jgi:hypothetical protein
MTPTLIEMHSCYLSWEEKISTPVDTHIPIIPYRSQ